MRVEKQKFNFLFNVVFPPQAVNVIPPFLHRKHVYELGAGQRSHARLSAARPPGLGLG